MSRAIKPPVDDEDLKTEIYDGGKHTDPDPIRPAPSLPPPSADGPPTIRGKGRKPTMPPPIPKAARQAVPAPIAKPEPSAPMKAISMKTPASSATEKKEPKAVRPQIPQVVMRSIGETSRSTPGRGLGNLAPPRDPREARKQRLWSNTFWASIAVIIASLVALAIWLIAGRK